MQVRDEFSKVRGLRLNWSKSQLLAIDDADKTALATFQLQWVDELTYLEVRISKNVADHYIAQWSTQLKANKAWENLPLSLLGHINLIKMKIYIFVL